LCESPVELGNGTNFLSVCESSFAQGAIGLSGTIWDDLNTTTNSVFFDDITILAEDGPAHYASSGTSIVTVEPPNWFDRWGRLEFSASVPTHQTKLTVDVLNDAGKLLAANVSSGVDLDAIPAVASARRLRLRANLATTDPAETPALSDWTVTWHLPSEDASESAWSEVVSSTQDDTPPNLVVTSPVDTIVTSAQVAFTGTSMDTVSGVSRVRILAGQFTIASTTNGFTNWVLNYTLPRMGTNFIRLEARDGATPANIANVDLRIIFRPSLFALANAGISPTKPGSAWLTAPQMFSDPASSFFESRLEQTNPKLRIRYVNGALFLFWPCDLSGCVVQSTTNLFSAEWADLASEPKSPMALSPTESQRFFRLIGY
jgi:hypothetical protein